MSGFSSMASAFARDAAVFAGAAVGERVIVTPRKGAAGTPGAAGSSDRGGAVTIDGALVFRDGVTGQAADLNMRLEYPVEVQIPVALYPGGPNVKGDQVTVAVRAGDTVMSTRVVAKIIGQVAGMWHLGLE